ncbi:hypothetical protein BDV26DRAFT_98545 [Aspergillus bertholletiae]|uniref:Uncharacterized protein n=1 Tax=Aspergillus bertholletiae TaxID=1226010 RepID=A0A5N7AUI4_9EURO|nr:hypothetical protein BDV26DRAFT_98545 [Aspergillus bertholletiae]
MILSSISLLPTLEHPRVHITRRKKITREKKKISTVHILFLYLLVIFFFFKKKPSPWRLFKYHSLTFFLPFLLQNHPYLYILKTMTPPTSSVPRRGFLAKPF